MAQEKDWETSLLEMTRVVVYYATEDDEKPVCQSSIGERGGRKRVEAGDHEDRYMIQNTLGYIGKQGEWVYILDLLGDLEGNIAAEMKNS